MSRKETFVGRADELATMGAELDRVRTGHPRVLWVSGPAGIGKTSLVRRLLDDRADVRVLRGDGDEGEAGLPFGVLGQLVGDVPRRFLGPTGLPARCCTHGWSSRGRLRDLAHSVGEFAPQRRLRAATS